MKTIRTQIDNGKLRIEAEATSEEVDRAFDQVANLEYSTNAGIVECLIPFALDKENIVPAITDMLFAEKEPLRGKGFTFSFEVTPKYEYELSSFEAVSFKMPPFEIEEGAVEEQIAQLAEQYAEYLTDTPRPIQRGDNVLISLNATQDGKPIPALNIDSAIYCVGTGSMPDDFDSNIIGMNVGETKMFVFAGQASDKTENATEQEVEATLTLHEIKKKVLPAINDAWVKKNMPTFQSEFQLRDALRQELNTVGKEQYETYKRQIAAGELAKRFDGTIDEAVCDAMAQSMINDVAMRCQQQGMTLEQFIEQNGGQQHFDTMIMLRTKQNLIEGYVLDSVFRHEKLLLTNEDLLEAAKTMNPNNPEVAKQRLEETGYGFALRETAQRIKASKWIVEHADISIE